METLEKTVAILFGENNYKLLNALVILVALDYIMGVCVAIRSKKLSSKIGAKGIVQKVIIFILVSLSHVVDTYLLRAGNAFQTVTILFYCSNELISILENAVNSGVPLPKKLKDLLGKLEDEVDEQ